MTNKEAVKLAYKELQKDFEDGEETNQWLTDVIEGLKQAEHDLNILEELKEPFFEEETDHYFVRREAYWDEYDNELRYGYAVYEWRGEYYEKKLSPVSEETFKFKKWEEVMHTTSTKKFGIDSILEMLPKLTNLKEELNKEKENGTVKD